MPTYGQKWPEYAKQWDSMKLRPTWEANLRKIALRLFKAKDRYIATEKATGVPWYMIAVIHERESSQNWKTQLGQGDPLNRVSTHIPRGRGPFNTWEEGAYDALVTLKHFNKIIDWRLEKILYYLELYNGWGYHNHNVPSAYLWAGTTIYLRGKYVADGVWSATAADSQPGCAALIKCLMELDPTIKPKREGNDAGTTAAGAGAVVVGGTVVAASQADPSTWMYWAAGVLIAAGLTAVVVWWYKTRIKKNVELD